MSDFSFMQSGSGNNRNLSDKQVEEIQSLVLLFAENAFKTAAQYVKHANRTIIQTKDIQNCMKIEAMIFCKKDNTLQDAKNLLEEIKNEEDNEDDNLDDIITNEEEEFTLSTCPCALCIVVKNLEDYWERWEPNTPLEISLKKNINKF